MQRRSSVHTSLPWPPGHTPTNLLHVPGLGLLLDPGASGLRGCRFSLCPRWTASPLPGQGPTLVQHSLCSLRSTFANSLTCSLSPLSPPPNPLAGPGGQEVGGWRAPVCGELMLVLLYFSAFSVLFSK